MDEAALPGQHEAPPAGATAVEELSSADDAARRVRHANLVRRTLIAGWGCVVLSALFLWLSKSVEPGQGPSSDFLWATYLMMARLCGMSSFAIGGVALYNHRWTEGVSMLLISVALPVLAFIFYGTI